MKVFLFILGLVVVGICGYSFEPRFRLALTGKTPVEKRAISGPAEALAAQPAVDLAKIPSDRLPSKVVLKAEAELVDSASDLKVKVSAGSQINLIRLEGSNVIISSGAGSFEGKVPIAQTDLMEQLAAMPDTPAPAEPAPVPTPETAPVPTPEPAPEPEPTPELAPAAEPEPTPEPAPAAEPTLEPTPAAEPEPTPESAPLTVPASAPAGSGDAVAIMKASIQAGEIKEFTFDQVLEWLPGEGSETIDGQSYQIGIASYKAETVFGVKTTQAKALIQGGKVARWLWPKSGMEIK